MTDRSVRRGRVTLLILLSLAALLSSAAAVESPGPAPDEFPATVDMTLKRVSEHVYFAQGATGVAGDNEGFISNAGVIVTGAGVVIFDALGTPALARLLLHKIREVTWEPVVRVIVSHYHADHIYGLQVLAEQDAEILAPAGAERYLASDAARQRLEERRLSLAPWVNEATRLVPPDQYLDEGARFRLGDVNFTVTVVGKAHSDGDLTLFVEPDRVLFSGDIIFEGRLPFLGDADTRRWLKVLERMEQEQLVALIPGHGAAAENPEDVIALTRGYLLYLHEQMAAAVNDFISFDEAYDAVDWSEYRELPAFDEANRRNAYQVYLSQEAELLAQ
jgi:glyoxylase-like metal-dependent hydrolase (beta-lactamase superfamily II)